MNALPVTYCTNIHPGESWAETRRNLETHTLAVKAALCPDRPFPVGLRVSGLASREVDAPEAARFREWLDENGLYVATVNGFPFGAFHGRRVKSEVYLPDWRDPVRLEYTLRLAGLLAVWLPQGMNGSISTVPLGFRAGFEPSQEGLALSNLRAALQGLDNLAQRTGKHIRLSIEPEPGCMVETTPELVALFDRLNLPDPLRPYVGICYDCCHQALQFEDPAASLKLLGENNIVIGHVQVSSALHLACPDLACLARFDEPVYLHQCVARQKDGSLARFDDLGEALAWSAVSEVRPPAASFERVESWRVHFHLPIFLAELPECLTTQKFLKDFLALIPGHVPLEVETYTFNVLPGELKTPTVVESIVREIKWVEDYRQNIRR